jgi:hypothetical protein
MDQLDEPHRSRVPAFLRPPSTRLGWAAVAGSLGAIALVVLVNLAAEGPGPPEGNPWWWQAFGTCALAGLLACGLAGLIAVVARHERSWLVIVPCALVLLVSVSELVQGLLELLG